MVKPDIQKIQNNEYIDLKEASRVYGYTQHHFGLLCRQGKLKAERIGKKWFTTREWIDEYLDEVEVQYKNNQVHYTQIQKSIREKPIKIEIPKLAVSIPKIKLPRIPFKFILASSAMAVFLISLYFGVQVLVNIDYPGFTKRTGDNFLSFSQNIKERTLSIVKPDFYQSQLYLHWDLIDAASKISIPELPSLEEVFALEDRTKLRLANFYHKLIITDANEALLSVKNYILEFRMPKLSLSQIFLSLHHKLASVPKEVSKVYMAAVSKLPKVSLPKAAFAEEITDSFKLFMNRTRDNIFAFGNDIKNWSGQACLAGRQAKDYLCDYGRSIKLALFDSEEKELVKEPSISEEIELLEPNEGMVVLPESFTGLSGEEITREIQDAFSDEVVVTPDEEDDTGIIQPVFKKDRGDEYMYVMVPVDKKENENENENEN